MNTFCEIRANLDVGDAREGGTVHGLRRVIGAVFGEHPPPGTAQLRTSEFRQSNPGK